MDVVVFGKHVEVPPDLRAHTRDKLERISKYAGDVRRVDVDYDEHATRKAADSHSCEILVHLNKHLVKGHACAADHYAALDLALEKVAEQMRRMHERRVHRRNNSKAARVNGASSNGVPKVDDLDADRDDEGEQVTVIVKTKQFAVKPMAAEEAALQMELLGHDFFLFTSTETGRAAVLYRRRDGNLGMIEASG
ncbi:MAG: ribosome hibernation-promoting factor, HPF/YfiA family [Actinomycetota bacterium]